MKSESLNKKIKKFDNNDRLYFHRYRLSNEEYHKCNEAVSSSALKELHHTKNPYWCYQKYIARTVPHKQTDAMLIGSATHKLILEPRSFHKEFVVWHGGRKAGKDWQVFKDENAGLDIITQSAFDDIRKMRDAVHACPEAAKLITGGVAEESVFWRDEETSVLLRARADYKKEVNGSKILIDLKTCLNAEPQKFTKDLINLGYPIQQALYLDGFQADAFAFLVVEKVSNTVQVYTLDDVFNEVGHLIYRQMLEQWKEHLETDIWPTYFTGPHELNCPEWFSNKVL